VKTLTISPESTRTVRLRLGKVYQELPFRELTYKRVRKELKFYNHIKMLSMSIGSIKRSYPSLMTRLWKIKG
jgi:hypothetical protein